MNQKVKCPNCGRTDFVTTKTYDSAVRARGDMVKCTLPYHIDWLQTSTTKYSEMTCPECLAQLAPSGWLTVVSAFEPAIAVAEPALMGDVGGAVMEEAQNQETAGVTLAVEPEPKVGKPVYICETCGKEVSSPLALSGHMRSHKEAKNGRISKA
jgi:hypothetical protein